MKRTGKYFLIAAGSLLMFCALFLTVLGFIPAKEDEAITPQAFGAGASSVEPSDTGLLREFPPVNEPQDNPTIPEKVELGRLLFFDPILSAENDIACATCHHPDYGFSDGLQTAVGAGGKGSGPNRTNGSKLNRNTKSLWNVAFESSFFWDGRVDSLEAQAMEPLTHPDEMAVDDLKALETELRTIPEYVSLFGEAFGEVGMTVTTENTVKALASFQRTLISKDSPFDRYAAGDFNALTPAQRRGLTLFRSAATRCFECHSAPTFSTETFRVIGVPDLPGSDPDPGNFSAGEGAFKVPSLRNVALTAPYMHNGVFSTLEEVVDFYANGGGRALGNENVDVFVLGFELTEQEKSDLIAFLYALTDEGNFPPIPASVPSGLPTVPKMNNPAREKVSELNDSSPSQETVTHNPTTIRVEEGGTIQSAVDQAHPGDTIEVPFGIYHERVVIDFNDITLVGITNEDGEMPILDGEGKLADGVIASGNNFEMANIEVHNYTSNGVLVEGVTGVHLHDIRVENTGIYGLYPVQSTSVLIERTEVTGAIDAGIYAGQCINVVVRDNVAYGNVLGIEIENTVGAEVYNNHTYNNALGIFIDLLPQLTSKVSRDTKVYNNLVENNNFPNLAQEGTAASLVPPGVGIGILSADQVEVFDNTIKDHKTAGLGVFHMKVGFEEERINVPANPEHNYIHNNDFENNGYDPDAFLTEMGIPGSDILWDGTGVNNRFDQPDASSFPPILPTKQWPDFFYNIYWRLVNMLTGIL